VKEIPSSLASRRATVSFASIVPSRKCFPMSRSRSMAVSSAVQSRLFTRRAAFSPSKARNGSICARNRSVHSATTSLGLRVRSPDVRGSPIIPVAPPTSAIGRWPARWRWRMRTSWTRWPWCREGAVGSKPQ